MCKRYHFVCCTMMSTHCPEESISSENFCGTTENILLSKLRRTKSNRYNRNRSFSSFSSLFFFYFFPGLFFFTLCRLLRVSSTNLYIFRILISDPSKQHSLIRIQAKQRHIECRRRTSFIGRRIHLCRNEFS